ncbi:MAG: DUF1203 domain-containing protein [Pseudomonadota bacterium]|nr:DUF1203 domain-containing protein [Pseudomonadota bacterium]
MRNRVVLWICHAVLPDRRPFASPLRASVRALAWRARGTRNPPRARRCQARLSLPHQPGRRRPRRRAAAPALRASSRNSPYRASGPIYVKVGGRQRTLAVGEVPESVRLRQISLRAYDRDHMIVAAEVCAGESVAAEIERLLVDPLVRYVHLHNAKRGCFSCLVRPVG